MSGNNWGCVRCIDEDGTASWHVVPMVNIDGEDIPSGSHDISSKCQCKPFEGQGNGGWRVWQHFDPTHAGAMTMEEWDKDIRARRRVMHKAAIQPTWRM